MRIRGSSESLTDAARTLRHSPTHAETVFWRVLRDRKRAGAKFRRQHPVGRFILDFYCPELKLVVELDGRQHDDQTVRDAERTAFLAGEGYHVLRFRNNEVLEDLEMVLRVLWRTIVARRAFPDPLPELGEGGEPRRAG